jgi:drug/metabolite transporter (DMT)-like permease
MTSDQVKSQALGLSLAVLTAVGCLAYEKITKSFSYFTVGLLAASAYVPFFITALLWDNQVKADFAKLSQHKGAIIVYLLSGATGPIWYLITKNQSVMVGAIYELKYILMLALFYIFFGDKPMTTNTVIGITFAVASVYFISKS